MFFMSTNFFLLSPLPSHLLLRQQDLSRKRPILAVAADVAVQPLHDRVDPDEAETMAFALGAAEQAALLLQLLPAGEVGKGNI